MLGSHNQSPLTPAKTSCCNPKIGVCIYNGILYIYIVRKSMSFLRYYFQIPCQEGACSSGLTSCMIKDQVSCTSRMMCRRTCFAARIRGPWDPANHPFDAGIPVFLTNNPNLPSYIILGWKTMEYFEECWSLSRLAAKGELVAFKSQEPPVRKEA